MEWEILNGYTITLAVFVLISFHRLNISASYRLPSLQSISNFSRAVLSVWKKIWLSNLDFNSSCLLVLSRCATDSERDPFGRLLTDGVYEPHSAESSEGTAKMSSAGL